MPFSTKFKKSMGFPRVGDQVSGFTIESISVKHEYVKGSNPRRYEYPIEMIVNGKGSTKDVEQALSRLFNQRDVRLLSGYGNPYLCNIGNMTISQLDKAKYEVQAQGSCVRTHTSKKVENMKEENVNLEELALRVYIAFSEGTGVVEVDHTLYPVLRSSRAAVRYVNIAGYSFIEQNPEKASRWGEKAREGHKILWVTKGRRYIAQVMDGKFLLLGKKK